MSNTLVYESLIKEYYENLQTTLRNFKPGPDFLEGWVHDENHHRSIVGIFEAANDNGVDELALEIGHQLSDSLDRNWLQEKLEVFGRITFVEEGPATKLKVVFARPDSELKIHPAYRKNLEKASHSIFHEGTVDQPGLGEALASSRCSGTSLSVLVDDGGIIKEARHSGASGLSLPLLDRLCELVRGLLFQDAAEHGVIYLEESLREVSVPPPVPGLVTPENADPAFELPTALIRDAYHTYLSVTGKSRDWNQFEIPPSSKWQSLSPQTQISEVKSTWNQLCKELGLPYADLEILAIKNGTRIVFSGQANNQRPSFGHDLMVLERELKKRLEKRLEVTLETVEDRNKRESRTKRETMPNK